MAEPKTYVFDSGDNSRSSVDPALLVALSQNGGFGGGANWLWPMFMYMMFPWLFGGMGAGFGGFGGVGGGALGAGATALGTGYLANQLNQNSNVDTLLQAMNGRADCISQLANILNTNVGNVQNGINALQAAVQQVSNLTGLTGQQVINSIQNGNANLSQQLCQCCCDMRYNLAEQTNTLQRQAADNFASLQLETCQQTNTLQRQASDNFAAQQLGMCQQTNQLGSQADRNTQILKDQIAAQSAMIIEKFCELEKRELLDKNATLRDQNNVLRGQLDNIQQTSSILGQVDARLAPMANTINQIAAKQPNTVPVQYPNVQAVDVTPTGCGCNRGNNNNGNWGGPWSPWGGPYWNGNNGFFG